MLGWGKLCVCLSRHPGNDLFHQYWPATVFTILGQLVTCSMAAYAFAG